MNLKSQWFWIFSAIMVLLYFTAASLSAICFPFLMGFIGAYCLNGPVSRMERHHISRGIGSAIIVLTVIFILVIMMMIFIPFVHQQLISLAINAPAFVDSSIASLKPSLDEFSKQMGINTPEDIKSHISGHVGDVFSWSLSIITNLLTNSMALANILSLIILTPIIMFYILKDWPKVISTIYNNIPYKYRDRVTSYATRIDTTLSDYGRGQAQVCLILMVLYSIALWTLNVKDGVFIGIMTGFMAFIPYVGMLMGLLATLASGLAHFAGWNQIGLIFLTFIVFNLFEGNFLSPRLIGEKVGVHPVWIIFSLLAGATWFGFLGILVALPMAAIIGVVVRILLEAYKSSQFYNNFLNKKKGLENEITIEESSH